MPRLFRAECPLRLNSYCDFPSRDWVTDFKVLQMLEFSIQSVFPIAATRALHEYAGDHMMAVASSPVQSQFQLKEERTHEKIPFPRDASCPYSCSHAGGAAG